MEGLKTKLAKMREDLEGAEIAEQEAKKQTKIAKERLARAVEEKRAKSRQIHRAQNDLEKVEDTTDKKLDKLERLSKAIHENECICQKLDRKELKDGDTFSHLESRHKSRRMYREEAEQRFRESTNRLMLVERETEKIDARIRNAKNNEAYFMKKLKEDGNRIGVLTKSGECQQAKCDESKEKNQRLREKKEKMVIVAETLERKEKERERQIAPLRDEAMRMTKQVQDLKIERRQMLDEMNTYP